MNENTSFFDNCTAVRDKNSPALWPCSGFTIVDIVATVIPTVLIMISIIFGNGLVVIAVIVQPKLRQFQNWYIVSLALADGLVGLTVMPFTLAYEIMGVWYFGMFLCELWLALDVLLVTASILHLCIISLDRYWAVTRPLTYRDNRSVMRAKVLITVAWVTSLLISLPPIMGWRPAREEGQCDLSKSLGYVLYSALGSFYVPVLILLFVYARIHAETHKRAKQKLSKARDIETSLSGIPMTPGASPMVKHNSRKSPMLKSKLRKTMSNKSRLSSVDVSEGSSLDTDSRAQLEIEGMVLHKKDTFVILSKDKQRLCKTLSGKIVSTTDNQVLNPTGSPDFNIEAILLSNLKKKTLRKQDLRATIILGFILAAFIICWLPFFVMYVAAAICCVAPDMLFKVFFWLGYCNSAINPVIYAVFNRNFRMAFKKLLRIS